jgi:hypothetical protein
MGTPTSTALPHAVTLAAPMGYPNQHYLTTHHHISKRTLLLYIYICPNILTYSILALLCSVAVTARRQNRRMSVPRNTANHRNVIKSHPSKTKARYSVKISRFVSQNARICVCARACVLPSTAMLISPWSLLVTLCTNRLNILHSACSALLFVYVSRNNSDYFPMRHYPIGLYNRDRNTRTNWIFIHNSWLNFVLRSYVLKNR